MDEHVGKNVPFDHTLEIIRIILELRSQFPMSAPDADNCSIEKCRLFCSNYHFYDQN